MKRKIILSLISLLVFSLTLQYSKAQDFRELIQEERESENIASGLAQDVKGKRPSGGKQSKKSFWDRLKGSISNIIKDKNIDDIKNIDIDNIKSPDDVMDIFQKLNIDIDDLDIDIDAEDIDVNLKNAIRKSNKKAKGDDDGTSDPEDDIEVEMFIEKISKEQFKQILAMAKAGNLRAQLEVALCYHAGNGVKQNFEKSAEWHYLATSQLVQLLLVQHQALSQMYNEYMQMMMHLGQTGQINPMTQGQGGITNPMRPASPMMGPAAPIGPEQINPASPIVPTSPMGPTSQMNPNLMGTDNLGTDMELERMANNFYNTMASIMGPQAANQMTMKMRQEWQEAKRISEKNAISWKQEQQQAADDVVALNRLRAELTSLTNSGDYNNPRMDEVSREIHAIENRQENRRRNQEINDQQRIIAMNEQAARNAKLKEEKERFERQMNDWKIDNIVPKFTSDPAITLENFNANVEWLKRHY